MLCFNRRSPYMLITPKNDICILAWQSDVARAIKDCAISLTPFHKRMLIDRNNRASFIMIYNLVGEHAWGGWCSAKLYDKICICQSIGELSILKH